MRNKNISQLLRVEINWRVEIITHLINIGGDNLIIAQLIFTYTGYFGHIYVLRKKLKKLWKIIAYRQYYFIHCFYYCGEFAHPVQCIILTNTMKKDQRVRETVKWKTPPLGTWKINVDAVVKEGQGTGFGVVIRDHRGKVVGSQFRFFRSILQIEEAEAMAVKDGVKLAKSLAGRDCILETD